MKSSPLLRATILSTAIAFALVGCGEDDGGMSQDDIQYLSHLDQSRFFQRQGELKASTLEARSAIELQPNKADPYFVIINNLVTAGDAVNAERQLNALLEALPENELTPEIRNQAAFIHARTRLMQGLFDEALTALESLENPDRAEELQADILKGKIYLSSARLGKSEEAYNHARDLDTSSVLPLVGLSRVAFARNNNELAEELVRQAEQIDPQDPELWLWKAQFAQFKGEWLVSEEAYIKALEDIGQYDVMTYRKYETISALIRVLREQGKISEAFVYEEILAKSAPGTIKSNLAAARTAFANGDLDAAGRYLEEILAQSPAHEQSALLLGMVRFRQGRTEEAEALLAPIAELGDSTEATKLLAATKLELRDPEAAKEILENLEGAQSDPDILALVGIASLASGDTDSGESFIEKSLELKPENDSLRLRYAAYLAKKGSFQKALLLTRQTLERDDHNEQAHVLLIKIHMDSGDQLSAMEAANTWVTNQPDNVSALIIRGQLAVTSDNKAEAKTYFDRAHQSDPTSALPLVALGNLAKSDDDIQAAKQYFSNAASIAPDNQQALQGVVSVLTRDETIALMHNILESKPDSSGPRLVLLEAALIDGNDSEADDYTAYLLEREDENHPSSAAPAVASIYGGVANRMAQGNNFERAQNVLNRGRILFPENQDIALQAVQLAYQTGNPDLAQDILKEIKLAHPDSARPFLLEANYQAGQGNHKTAAELFQLALNKQDIPQTAIAYARALQKAGMTDQAIGVLEEASTRHSDNAPILLNLAMMYQESHKDAQAEQAYEKLLQLAPDNVLALNNLAWMYHQNGNEKAGTLAERAYELNPESAAIADTYGWITFQAGKTAESVPILEKAYQLRPDSQEIAMHLVEAYKASGRNSDAKVILESFEQEEN